MRELRGASLYDRLNSGVRFAQRKYYMEVQKYQILIEHEKRSQADYELRSRRKAYYRKLQSPQYRGYRAQAT